MSTSGSILVSVKGLLIGEDGLLKLRYNRVEGPLLSEPMGKEMHAHIREMRLYPDDLGSGAPWLRSGLVARSAFGPTELPLTPQAIEMAHTDVQGGMSLGDLVEQESTGALRIVVKDVPHHGLVNLPELSTGTKGWT
jgi:hypothetical protein